MLKRRVSVDEAPDRSIEAAMIRNTPPIGELFILGFDNGRVDLVEQFHRSFGLGGVIVFARNIESPSDLKLLIDDVKRRTAANIIVAVDQEGGAVVRLSGSEFPTFPSPAFYGDRHDLEGALHAAMTTACELKKLGINMNLAPVADVLTNPDNLLMKRRCFSGDVGEVSRFVEGVVRAQTEAGIASCAKHFPGLGDSVIDPHEKAAVCKRSDEYFRDTMFPPFAAAIRAGAKAIMTTHLLAPSLDPTGMATFSPRICRELIRGSLGFGGVVLSDDLDMGAVQDPEQAVPKAIAAGHDMILICHAVEKQIACADNLLKYVKSGNIDERDIVRRIESVRNLKKMLVTAT